MPLSITDEELEEGLSILARTIGDTASRLSPVPRPQ
jgi:hypothetical protein